MTGWIKLHRQIMKHPLYEENRKFSKFEAWVDLLLQANHSDKKWLLGTKFITVKRGSFITSELKLMERWGWGKTKLRTFLKSLENEDMIVKKSDSKKTTIFIVNYDKYQSQDTTDKLQPNINQTITKPQPDTTKNVNNDKNEKKKEEYAEFVRLTADEYQELVAEYGEGAAKKMIEDLNNYKGSNGKKYKDDYRAIRSWVVDKVRKNNPNVFRREVTD